MCCASGESIEKEKKRKKNPAALFFQRRIFQQNRMTPDTLYLTFMI